MFYMLLRTSRRGTPRLYSWQNRILIHPLQSDWVKYQCFMLAAAAEGLVEVDDGLQGCKAVIDHVETCREQRLAGCD